MTARSLRSIFVCVALVVGAALTATPVVAAEQYECAECKPDPANPNQTVCAGGRSIGTWPGCATCLRVCAYV